jgi:hypothetical protein
MWLEVGSLDKGGLEDGPLNEVLPDTAVKGALLGVASRGILSDVDSKRVLLRAPPQSVLLDGAPKDEAMWTAGIADATGVGEECVPKGPKVPGALGRLRDTISSDLMPEQNKHHTWI